MREPNPDKLNELVGKLVNDLGASIAGASILVGDRLGIYKAMADGMPVTSADLAKKTGLHERYLREWLSGQAASGYIDFNSFGADFHTAKQLHECDFGLGRDLRFQLFRKLTAAFDQLVLP